MTLTQLVDLKTRLQNFSILQLQSSAKNLSREVDSWRNIAADGEIKNSLDFFLGTFNSIHANTLSIDTLLKETLERVEDEIQNKSSLLLTLGYTIQGQKVLGSTETADVERKFRTIEVSDEFAEQLGSRIRQYTNWKYPCLEIGPGDGFWTDNLVGSDPLYLVDIHKEFLDQTLQKYLDIYKKRIRTYLIGSAAQNSEYNVGMLPDGQIGFIFSWAVFDYIPYQQAKSYIESCVKSLRPGGVMLFSYNDCDYYKNAAAAEGGLRAWMTKKLLGQIFDDLGLELIGFFNSDGFNHNWAEIKKPGHLYSMKTTQPLFNINTRPGFERVDTEPERQYNKQQIARLKQIAIKMGLDTDENIMADKYRPHDLEKLINIARMNK